MQVWHLYMVRTRHGALYTGITTDVARRLRTHAGKGKGGAKYLRARGPLKLAYRVRIGSRPLALKAEHRIKVLSKPHKERIVAGKPRTRTLLNVLGLDRPE